MPKRNEPLPPADEGPVERRLGLVERLRQQYPKTPHHRDALHREAADEIDRLRGTLDRMDSELRNEREPRSVVQRAMLMAAMLPHNQDKPAGAVRVAAVELFGQEAVDAAMQVWRA